MSKIPEDFIYNNRAPKDKRSIKYSRSRQERYLKRKRLLLKYYTKKCRQKVRSILKEMI